MVMIIIPINVGKVNINTSVIRSWIRSLSQPTATTAKPPMAARGMSSKRVCREVQPKDLVIMFEKAELPPLGTPMHIIIMNIIQVRMSLNVSTIW